VFSVATMRSAQPAMTALPAKHRPLTTAIRGTRPDNAAHSLNARGIAGLIKEFKLNGMIRAAQPLFEEIRQNGFWLRDDIVKEILRELGEIA